MLRRPTSSRMAAVVALAAAVAALLTGCGTSNSGTGGSGSGTVSNKYKADLETLYKGTFTEPKGPQVAAEPGKNVWVISVGQSTATTATATDGMKAAGKALGWKVTIFDGQYDPSKMLSGVNQAVVDGADGIVLLYVDCTAVKNGVQAAVDKGVPVIGVEVADCSPSLLSGIVTYAGHESFPDYMATYGAAQARYVIATGNGRSDTLLAQGTDQLSLQLLAKGAKEELDKCSGCKTTLLPFVGADTGPALQQKISQALLKNPNATSFIAPYDEVLTSGGAQAIVASGRAQKMTVVGGVGTPAGVQLIDSGSGMNACVGIPPDWEGYAAFDGLIRAMAGANPADLDSGIGIQVCDKDHNFPSKGKAYSAPIDFAPAFYKLWGVQ